MTRLMLAGVILAVAGCAAPSPEPVDVSAKSAALADRFQADLQGQLQAAMKAGGPVGAIGVCQQAAPAIAASLSEESGAEVRRIALRERNPAAAPEGDLRERLEQLAAAPLTSAGKPAVMQWTSGSGADARAHYMRAIPMKEQPCAACHGTSIGTEVRDKLAELYPADKATGFKPGDLRGAILVSWPVGAAKGK
ncbi:DUF3365 domain-containing protein [Novosphingobium sp.]|uniref:Tll0287-like domain-containing protein n=1 Tax=Novosphingobium sp. TaxID=1874826 RepID=UPI0035B11E8E